MIKATKTIKTVFGAMVEIPHQPDQDMVVLCEMSAGGYVPIKLLLPHQVYLERVDKTKRYVAMPLRSEEYVEIVPDEVLK